MASSIVCVMMVISLLVEPRGRGDTYPGPKYLYPAPKSSVTDLKLDKTRLRKSFEDKIVIRPRSCTVIPSETRPSVMSQTEVTFSLLLRIYLLNWGDLL